MASKHVIFDMDGVLIHEGLDTPVNDELFRPFGVLDTEEKRADVFTGRRSREFLEDAVKKFNLSADPEELFERRLEMLEKRVETDLKPVEGAVGLMESLKERGTRIAVASSTERRIVEKILKTLGAIQLIEFFLGGEDVKRGKPNPDVFLKAADLLEAESEECIVVEDSVNGIRAAKAAGMTVIGFGENGKLADYGASTMEEVRNILEKLLE